MPEKQGEPRKVAPPRNNFESDALYRNSRATEYQNRDPDYVYENFSTDPESPAYVGKRLAAHERGNAASGFVMVKAWEVVHSQTDANVRALDPREDQGKAVDTVARYGRQVLCRISRTEHAKYALADRAYEDLMERQIYDVPDRLRDGRTAVTTTVSRDENADHIDMLRRAGHPLPGG